MGRFTVNKTLLNCRVIRIKFYLRDNKQKHINHITTISRRHVNYTCMYFFKNMLLYLSN